MKPFQQGRYAGRAGPRDGRVKRIAEQAGRAHVHHEADMGMGRLFVAEQEIGPHHAAPGGKGVEMLQRRPAFTDHPGAVHLRIPQPHIHDGAQQLFHAAEMIADGGSIFLPGGKRDRPQSRHPDPCFGHQRFRGKAELPFGALAAGSRGHGRPCSLRVSYDQPLN